MAKITLITLGQIIEALHWRWLRCFKVRFLKRLRAEYDCKIHLAYKINIRKTLASQILLLSIHPSFRPPPWYGNHSIFMWRTNHKLVFPQAECLVKSQDKCLLKWLRGSTKEAAPETCMQSFYPYIHYAVLHYIAWALPGFYIKNAAL